MKLIFFQAGGIKRIEDGLSIHLTFLELRRGKIARYMPSCKGILRL